MRQSHFYKSKFEGTTFPSDNGILNQFLEAYLAEPCIALESIVVDLFKRNLLTDDQVDAVQQWFSSNEINNRVLIFKSEKSLQDGKSLDEDTILALLSVRAYTTINQILDKTAIKSSALKLFKELKPDKKDARHKKQLFEKAMKFI